VEDNEDLANSIKRGLEKEGYSVQLAFDGDKGLDMALEGNYDCIVLDVLLPGVDGFEFVQTLRETGVQTPVLMLTALDSVDDKITGLSSGADDYLTKPFEVQELRVRVRALLRRSDRIPQAAKHGEILTYGPLTLVPERFEALWFGKTIKLTHLEFDLLHCLMQRHGQTVSPSEILQEVWGYEPDDDIETIRVHIRHLRTKLEPDPRHPQYIKTVYGAGYCLELPNIADPQTLQPELAKDSSSP